MKTNRPCVSALSLAFVALASAARLFAAAPTTPQGLDFLKDEYSPFQQREDQGGSGITLDSPLEYRGMTQRGGVTYLGFIDVNTRVTTWVRADGQGEDGQPDPSSRITVSNYEADDDEAPIKVVYTPDTGTRRTLTLVLKTSQISVVRAQQNNQQNTNVNNQNNQNTAAALQQLVTALGGANANQRGTAAGGQIQTQQQGRGNQRGAQQGGAAAGGRAGGAAGGAAAGGGGRAAGGAAAGGGGGRGGGG
jgi:hypothetical protein